jgi:hypothetical protein
LQIIQEDQEQIINYDVNLKKDKVAIEEKLSFNLYTNKPSKKSSNSAKKQQLNGSQEKSLDSWSTIREAFPNLYHQLNPNDTESEVDKAVKYILDSNIPISQINVKYGSVALSSFEQYIVKKNRKKAHLNLKVGRFSPGRNGEDGIILQNWENLAKAAELEDPPQCIQDLKNLCKSGISTNVKKRNAIGCCLGQDLPYIRHGGDVLQRAVTLLYPWKKGKFSKDEDEIILKDVRKNGPNPKTFQTLTDVLERPADIIRNRYYEQINCEGLKSGKWKLADYEQFFEFLFREEHTGNKSGVDYINSIPKSVIDDAAKLLNWKPKSMYKKWLKNIKPDLLSYHSGSLHSDVKSQFYTYLVDNKINFQQEIDWEDVIKEFPNCSSQSLGGFISDIYRNKKLYKVMPLYLAAENYNKRTKRQKSKKQMKLKKDIISLYNKARGVLPTEN